MTLQELHEDLAARVRAIEEHLVLTQPAPPPEPPAPPAEPPADAT